MNVANLLETQKIDYKIQGGDYVVCCLNPEHEDNNPSLRISAMTGAAHCFSCGFSTNIYKHFSVFRNTFDLRILTVMNKINALLNSSITKPFGYEKFILEHRGISSETYEEFEAFTHPLYPDMVMFPIYDITGELLVLQGRKLYSDIQPKYKFYPASVPIPLFPAIPKVQNSHIVLVEGMFDFLNLYDKGLKSCVCYFGCSVSKDKSKVLARFQNLKLQGVNKISILFDNDQAGRQGALKLKNTLSGLFLIDILQVSTDPGDLSLEEVTNLKNTL